MDTPEQVSAELVNHGAVITVWNSPPESYLVGRLQWLSEGRLFFFAANGDGAADAHWVDFDSTTTDSGGVRFFKEDKLVGLLTSLDRTNVADREDYEVGWQIWQTTAPMKQRLIDELVDASRNA